MAKEEHTGEPEYCAEQWTRMAWQAVAPELRMVFEKTICDRDCISPTEPKKIFLTLQKKFANPCPSEPLLGSEPKPNHPPPPPLWIPLIQSTLWHLAPGLSFHPMSCHHLEVFQAHMATVPHLGSEALNFLISNELLHAPWPLIPKGGLGLFTKNLLNTCSALLLSGQSPSFQVTL